MSTVPMRMVTDWAEPVAGRRARPAARANERARYFFMQWGWWIKWSGYDAAGLDPFKFPRTRLELVSDVKLKLAAGIVELIGLDRNAVVEPDGADRQVEPDAEADVAVDGAAEVPARGAHGARVVKERAADFFHHPAG